MIENVTEYIAELIDMKIEVDSFSINGIQLGNSVENIPISEIVDMSLSNQKTGQFIENSSDYTFQERLEMLDTHNSFIHLAGGLVVNIQNQIIDQISISKRYLDNFSSIDKNQIEKKFGKPDYELVDDIMMGVTIYDYSIENFISVYGKLYLFFEPKNYLLQRITLGYLNEEYYRKYTANSK